MERSLFQLIARNRCGCRVLVHSINSSSIQSVREFFTYHRPKTSVLVKFKMKIETFHDVRKRRISTRYRDLDTNRNCSNGISNMATIIDGKQTAKEIRMEVKAEINALLEKGHRKPQLTAILVGDDPASEVYIKMKMEAAKEVGIDSITKRFPADISEIELLNEIEALNKDPNVDGILVQLPLPAHIDEQKACNAVSADKDVDGFNEVNIGRLALDMGHLIPCTPLGVYELLKRYKIETFGKNAVVVGRSKHVSLPMAMLLHTDGKDRRMGLDATVTICHRYTPPEELKKFCLQADIIVVATGIPRLIKADMIKPGACVIDVGITRVKDPETGKDKLIGDVDFDNVKNIAGYITPVPGGVGPMTVAMLMKNTLRIAKRNN